MRWEEAKLERLTHHRELGAGLRYLVGDENRYASVDDPQSGADIGRLASQLWPDKPAALKQVPVPAAPLTRSTRAKIPLGSVPPQKKAELLERCYRAANVPGVRQISIQYGEAEKRI